MVHRLISHRNSNMSINEFNTHTLKGITKMKQSIELKIKAKHLALEPAIIRKEERKLHKMAKNSKDSDSAYSLLNKAGSLRDHRRTNVRQEARATHLARAFIAGQSYRQVEVKSDTSNSEFAYIANRVVKMLISYHKDPYVAFRSECIKEGINYRNVMSAEEFYKQKVSDWIKAK